MEVAAAGIFVSKNQFSDRRKNQDQEQ